MLMHVTTVAIEGEGVILRGPSGVGKSDLALRLIDTGAELVADDQTEIQAIGKKLIAETPEALAGLIEVRGVGILRLPHRPSAVITLLVDLTPEDVITRLPEPEFDTIAGIQVSRLYVSPLHASAPLKIKLALQHGIGVSP